MGITCCRASKLTSRIHAIAQIGNRVIKKQRKEQARLRTGYETTEDKKCMTIEL
jgi:hypothetical protein